MTTVPHSDDTAPAPDTFETFYRTTAERTFRIACRMALGDRALAREVTQNAYEHLLRDWPARRHRATGDNARYAAGVAVRAVVDTHRHDHDGTEAESGYDDGHDRPLLDAARDLIDRQPVMRRAVAILYFLADCDHAEMAEVLGVAESAVRVHVERTRVLMKPLLDDAARGRS